MAEESEYVAQLKEVFLSCDSTGSGKLNRRDLTALCEKLQLEDQADTLIDRLIGTSDRCVGFEEFKDGFVLVLSSVVDTLDSTEDEASVRDEGLTTPMREGGKRISSNIEPDGQGADTPLDFPTDMSDTELSYASPSDTPQPRPKRKHLSTHAARDHVSAVADDSTKRSRPDDKAAYTHADVFETEGMLAHSSSNENAAEEAAKEEEHLRSIWRLLGVGTSGYLSIDELAIVCEHIGMEAMDEKELRHLFEKLDADGDQRVSFEEFLGGLFQHGGRADADAVRLRQQRSLSPVRPMSSQKRVVRVTSSLTLEGDRGGMQTPSIFSAMFGPGFFSYVDSDSNGCARTEDILQVWENFGVSRSEASAVLQALELDGADSVRLRELSMALERELLTNDLDNAVYQVAVCSLRKELQHSRATLEAGRAEADALRAELDMVRARGEALVRESDERHARLERALEARASDAERRHAEQARAAQAQADADREAAAAAVAQQRLQWEAIEARHRDDEARLREALAAAEHRAEMLEVEARDGAALAASLSAEAARLRRELDCVPALRSQIMELEASRDELRKELNAHRDERLQQHEGENKSLRDRNDELTAEVESLRQQLAGRGRRGRSGSSSRDSAAALRRQGSRLSDYPLKTPLSAKSASADGGSSQSDDDEHKAALLEAVPASAVEVEKLRMEVSSLKSAHEETLKQLKVHHEQEKRQLVKARADELRTHSVEAERRQVEAVQKVLMEEKARSEKSESDFRRLLENDRAQLREEAERERRDASERHEAEKQSLMASAAAKHSEDIQRVQASVAAENEAQQRLSHSRAVSQFQQALAKGGVSALTGKLRDDFDRLVAQAVDDRCRAEERESNVSRERELTSLRQRHEEQMDEMEQQMAELEQQMEEERVAQQRRHEQQIAELVQRAEDERTAAEELYERRLAEVQQQLDDEKEFLAEELRSRMETEFIGEIDKIRAAFQEERDDYESRIQRVQQELQHAKACSQEEAAARAAADAATARASRSELEASRADRLHAQRQLDVMAVEKAKLEREAQRLRLDLEHRQHAHEHEVALLRRQLIDVRQATAPQHSSSLPSTDDNATVAAERRSLMEENERLERQHADLAARAQQSEERVFELSTQLQLAESQRERETQELRLALGKMVDAAVLRTAEAQCVAEKRRCEELEQAMDNRAAETNRLLLHMQEEHKLALMGVAAEQDTLRRKLEATRSTLAEVTQKLKVQLERSARSDYLVKDLYVENAQLMKALYLTEQRQKTAEHAKYQVEGQRQALQDALLKICPAAVASV